MNQEKTVDTNQLLDSSQDKSRKGDHEGAIKDLDRALQINPSDANVYGHRCVAHYKLGNKQSAVADCQQAATLYLEQGKIKEYQYSLRMLEKLQGSESRN